MDKHIPTNNKIIGDKPNQQLFPKQVAKSDLKIKCGKLKGMQEKISVMGVRCGKNMLRRSLISDPE